MSLHEIIIAGFGGQGILSAGRLLAYAGMVEKKEVSFLPSYGPEMRGGTANCMVVISEQDLASPVVSAGSALIVMNNPSLEKFENWVKPGGIIITDSSMVHTKTKRSDVKVFEIPATKLSTDMGNKTYSNIYLLGKLLKETNCIKQETFEKALYSILSKKKHYMIPEEMEVLKVGMNY